MSETKFTPGPWNYQEESDAYTHIVRGPNNFLIVQFSQNTSDRVEADARLTAAAPELLEALEEALADIRCYYGTTYLNQHAKAEQAIAKARGETNE